MLKYLTVLLALMLVSVFSQAQPHKTYTINPGDRVAWSVPFNDRYEYPAFKPGIVYFKNKTTGGGMMNYSYLGQEMFFIDGKGDTLALAEPKEVDSVLFDKDIFYNSPEGFVKLDTLAGDVRLCKAKFFYITNKQVTGAYGQPTDAAGNDRFKRFSSNYAAANIVAQDIFTLGVKHTMYAGRRFGKMMLVNKKNMSSLFGKNENAFDQYLQQNIVNFSERDDIVKMLLWMSGQ
jgi:hypothetical protein